MNMTEQELELWFKSFRQIKNFSAFVTKDGDPCIMLTFRNKENAMVFNKGMGEFAGANKYEMAVYHHDTLPEYLEKAK